MFNQYKKFKALDPSLHILGAAIATAAALIGFMPKSTFRKITDAFKCGFFAMVTPILEAPLMIVDGFLQFALKRVEGKPSYRQPSTNDRAFSLIEIIVVIAIIGIISGSSIFGFGRLADILQVKQVNNAMDDTIKNAQLEVLRQDYSKVTIHFMKDYLALENDPHGSTSKLVWSKVGCDPGQSKVIYSADGTLTKKDAEGNVLDVQTVISGESSGCLDFASPSVADTQWNYSLTSGTTLLGEVRLIHFNLNRESTGNLIKIVKVQADADPIDYENDAYQLYVEAPYANKRVTKEGAAYSKPVTLLLQDTNQNSDLQSFVLQK